jgi:hypothetical protein
MKDFVIILVEKIRATKEVRKSDRSEEAVFLSFDRFCF